MTGPDAGKRERAFQMDLFWADLKIGFALIRSARAGYELGQPGPADRNLECARDAYSDASRLLASLAGPDMSAIDPDLSKLQDEIEATERLRNNGWWRARAVYN